VTVAGPPVVVAPLTGFWEETVAGNASATRVPAQRRDNDDPEVRDRAPERGERWIPPLGPERKDGPLEPPEFDDEPDDDELAGQGGDDSGRAPGVARAATRRRRAGPTT